jgi:hypothetical protein
LRAQPRLALLFFSREVPADDWLANRRGRYTVVPPGPFEVNWDYYPTWEGPERLVVTDATTARALRIE